MPNQPNRTAPENPPEVAIKSAMQDILSGGFFERIRKFEELEAKEERLKNPKAEKVIIRRELKQAIEAGNADSANRLRKRLGEIIAEVG